MSNQHKAIPAGKPVAPSLSALFESGQLTTTKAVKQLGELKKAHEDIKNHVMDVTLDHFLVSYEKAEKSFDQCVQICDAILPAYWYEGHKSEALTEKGKQTVKDLRKSFLAKSKARGHKNPWAQWTHLLNTAKKKHDGKSGSSAGQRHFDERLPEMVKDLNASHVRAVDGTQDLTSAKSKAFMKELVELRDKHYKK
jgi:flagellar hook-basal body complex protein FliE